MLNPVTRVSIKLQSKNLQLKTVLQPNTKSSFSEKANWLSIFLVYFLPIFIVHKTEGFILISFTFFILLMSSDFSLARVPNVSQSNKLLILV